MVTQTTDHRCPRCGRTFSRPVRCGDCDVNTYPAPSSAQMDAAPLIKPTSSKPVEKFHGVEL